MVSGAVASHHERAAAAARLVAESIAELDALVAALDRLQRPELGHVAFDAGSRLRQVLRLVDPLAPVPEYPQRRGSLL